MGELGYNVSDERGCDAAMAVCGGVCVWLGQGFCVRFVRSGQVEWCLTRGLLYFADAAGSVCIRNVQGGAARVRRVHSERHHSDGLPGRSHAHVQPGRVVQQRLSLPRQD